jgi:hypothetical protein
MKIWSFIKAYTLMLYCETNVSQRMDDEEEQRTTDKTSWILPGMPTTTAYKTLTMEYRKESERIMAGDKTLLSIRYRRANV